MAVSCESDWRLRLDTRLVERRGPTLLAPSSLCAPSLANHSRLGTSPPREERPQPTTEDVDVGAAETKLVASVTLSFLRVPASASEQHCATRRRFDIADPCLELHHRSIQGCSRCCCLRVHHFGLARSSSCEFNIFATVDSAHITKMR